MTTHYQTLPGRTLCNDQSRRFKRLTTDVSLVTCEACKKWHKDDTALLYEKFLKGVTV